MGVEVDRNLTKDVCNRKDVILSLKFSYGSVMEDLTSEIPTRIRLYSELIDSWSSLTQSGCRYLLPALDHFIHQIAILTKMKIKWLDGYVLPEISSEIILYARLGLSVSLLKEADWSVATPRV